MNELSACGFNRGVCRAIYDRIPFATTAVVTIPLLYQLGYKVFQVTSHYFEGFPFSQPERQARHHFYNQSVEGVLVGIGLVSLVIKGDFVSPFFVLGLKVQEIVSPFFSHWVHPGHLASLCDEASYCLAYIAITSLAVLASIRIIRFLNDRNGS